MKKSELIFNLVSIPNDVIMLGFAGVASFYLRQQSTSIVGPIIFQLKLQEFFILGIKIIPILLIIFASLGLYNLKSTRKFSFEFWRITIACSLALLFIMLLFFFNRTVFPSRFIILTSWLLGIIFILLGRLFLRTVQRYLFLKGFGLHKIVLINNQDFSMEAVEQFYKNFSNGYSIVAEINSQKNPIEELENIYKTHKIDEILQADTKLDPKQNLKLLEFSRSKGLSFSFMPNLFEVQRNAIEIMNLNGLPIISLKNTPLDGWGRVIKRLFDIIVSSVCILLTLPIFLVVVLAIKLDSNGKVIYSALRGGKNSNFKFYKFRTMYQHMSVGEEYGGKEAEKIRKDLWKKNDRGGENAPFLKIKHDPRVTKIGRFLRRTKLDEIPQFWNVIKGDMSMVGPRAHVVDEVERYKNQYQRMFSIKPGIFGLSQIAQFRWPDLPFEEEIRLNTYYIENWSLWLDIKVLTQSFWLLFFTKKSKADY